MYKKSVNLLMRMGNFLFILTKVTIASLRENFSYIDTIALE